MTGREWDADVASYKAAVQDYRKRRFRSNVQAPLLEPVQQHVAPDHLHFRPYDDLHM